MHPGVAWNSGSVGRETYAPSSLAPFPQSADGYCWREMSPDIRCGAWDGVTNVQLPDE